MAARTDLSRALGRMARKPANTWSKLGKQDREALRMAALFLEEFDDSNRLFAKLCSLLERTADALKGAPDELHLHDWSDLPVVAARLRRRVTQITAGQPHRAPRRSGGGGQAARKGAPRGASRPAGLTAAERRDVAIALNRRKRPGEA